VATAATAATVAMAAIELQRGGSLGEAGRYRLEGMLGAGGMASVWLAHDRRLERKVAIKVLSDVLALDHGYVSRFRREARVAANLSHPHLVNIFDFSVGESRPYLVMEYIAGGNLADRLRQADAPALDVETLARQLLDALGYIHRAGIIHRDIKPANVLIGADGVRLTDFGIAQPLDDTRLTTDGLVIGSARFIAPEVMRGHPASRVSDLYSLGVLIECCLPAGATSQLHELVEHLTASEADRRPASAEEAIAILGRAQTRATRVIEPVSNRTSGRVTRSRRVTKPPLIKRALATIAILALLVIVIGVYAVSGGGGHARTVTHPVRSAPKVSLGQLLDRLDQAISRSSR
jgi:serine/threonine protein kinase